MPYSVVYAFAYSTKMNPITGYFAIKLVFVFLMRLVVAVALFVGGLLSKKVAKDNVDVGYATGCGGALESAA